MRLPLIIETPTGWMLKCRCGTCGWHEFPKQGKPGASWTFNGDVFKPTFSPSMNSLLNDSSSPNFNPDAHLRDFRCHFIVTEGRITFCGDCSHSLAGQSFELEPWPEADVAYYRNLMEEHRRTGGRLNP